MKKRHCQRDIICSECKKKTGVIDAPLWWYGIKYPCPNCGKATWNWLPRLAPPNKRLHLTAFGVFRLRVLAQIQALCGRLYLGFGGR